MPAGDKLTSKEGYSEDGGPLREKLECKNWSSLKPSIGSKMNGGISGTCVKIFIKKKSEISINLKYSIYYMVYGK